MWIGGFKDKDSGIWYWVNEEGSIPSDENLYTNWAVGEPNNAGPGEYGLTLGRFPGVDGLGGWNDEGAALDLIGGFVVEYGNTTDAENCVVEPDPEDPAEEEGCNPSGMQNVQIPPFDLSEEPYEITEALLRRLPGIPAPICGIDDMGEPMVGSAFTVRDPRLDEYGVPTGPRVSLNVFDYFVQPESDPDNPISYELILDENTYGSPCFAVVFGNATFNVEDVYSNGVAITRLQYPENVPGIGDVNTCYNPGEEFINTDGVLVPHNPDLQKTSQLTYQTDDRYEMVEEAAAVVTNACFNPSRGSTVKFSFGVLNTVEHCGLDFYGPNGPAEVLQCFNNLAVAKFDALDEALYRAAPTLNSPKLSSLTKEVSRARSMVKNGHFPRAVTRLVDLLDKVDGADWDFNQYNHPGVLVMRIENLLFRVDQLETAEANLP